jgi:alkylated DNA repair dioxygenase AlkB
MNIKIIKLEDECECYYVENFYNDDETKKIIEHIESKYKFISPKIKIFGKIIDQPRETAWLGPKLQKGEEDREHHKIEDDKNINLIRKKIEKTLKKINTISKKITFNACLINKYEDGQKSVGYHDDLEDNLEDDPYIASLSLGATRKFKIKHKKSKKIIDIELKNGDLIIMGSKMQQHYLHSVPKTAKKVGVRYNLTFRKYIE